MDDTKPIDLNKLLEVQREHLIGSDIIKSMKEEFLERYVTVLKLALEKRARQGHRLGFELTHRELADLFRFGWRELFKHTTLHEFFCDFTKNPEGYLEKYIEGEFEMRTVEKPKAASPWETKLVFYVSGSAVNTLPAGWE